MKKLFLSIVLIFSMIGVAGATSYTYTPLPDPTLGDLDHGHFYTWGIDCSNIADGEDIISASLSFSQIYNWNYATNDLFVHLLDYAAVGVAVGYDSSWWSWGDAAWTYDNFTGQGIELAHYKNLSTTPQDLTINITGDALATLISYLSDDIIGFGIDPDCHFYNNGVAFTIETETAPVPEPATMFLLGAGLLGMAGISRKKLSKK